ncbi:MAG: hypothetical protein ABI355_12965 [Solirubrobacteraceae bacterium]
MSRATRIATVVGLLVGVAALAGPSLAANPTQGGRYVGQWKNGPIGPYPHEVIVNVSKDGKSAKATLYCQGRRIDSTSRFAITKGGFDGQKRFGSSTEWTIKGHFVSSSQAKANVTLKSTCDDSHPRGLILTRM